MANLHLHPLLLLCLLANAIRAGLVFLAEQQRLSPTTVFNDLRGGLLLGQRTFE